MKDETIGFWVIIIGLFLFFKMCSGCSLDPNECETVSTSITDNIIVSTSAKWNCWDYTKQKLARDKIEELLDDKGCIKMTGEISDYYDYGRHIEIERSATYAAIPVIYSFKGLDKSERKIGNIITVYGKVSSVKVKTNGQSGSYSSGGILHGSEKCSASIVVNLTNSGTL